MGESGGFWTLFFVQFLGTLGAALIAVWQFRASIRKENEKKRSEDNDHNNEKMNYLTYLIEGSVRFGKDLVGYLQEIEHNLKTNIYYIGDYKSTSSSDLQRSVDLLNRESYFHIYLTLFKDEKIKRIFTSLDTLNAIRLSSEEIYKSKFEKAQKEMPKVLNKIQEITSASNSISGSSEIKPEFINKLQCIRREFSSTLDKQGRNFDLINDHLFVPIAKAISEHFSHGESQTPIIVNNIYDSTIAGAVSISNMKVSNSNYLIDLSRLIEQINTTVEILEVESKQIKDYLNRLSQPAPPQRRCWLTTFIRRLGL